MAEKPITLDGLFATIQLSDPLKTYKENMDTIQNLVELGTRAIKRRTDAILESIEQVEKSKKESEEKIAEGTEKVKQHQEDLKERVKWYASLPEASKQDLSNQYEEINSELKSLIQDRRQLISDRKKNLVLFDSFVDSQREQYKSSLKSSEIELPALRQMVFIYLVTVWDAFVLDTVRAILRIHPELISKSENKTDLTKSDLWFLGSTEELREFLIELEIRRLDGDRKQLVETFNSYWGIDWGDSGIQMDIIVEIRARRDLWVHNRGRVNNQYMRMVKEQTTLSLGQIAEIDSKYFRESLLKLTQLAVNIHRIADEKHYSKST